jgi:hypothetical protein
MLFGTKFSRIRAELARTDVTTSDKLLLVTQRTLDVTGLEPRVAVSRRVIVEIRSPPKPFRGMRDLVVRRGTVRDLDALTTIDDTPPQLVRDRLARGELAYVGEVDGDILCHTWFHPGPLPFDEDRSSCTSWGLDDDTYWSFNGASRADARASGVFVKLFQEALRDVFEVHGAKRVQGFILARNRQSLIMHERLGFTILGSLFTAAVGPLKWLQWTAGSTRRQWLLGRHEPEPLSFPPPPAPPAS